MYLVSRESITTWWSNQILPFLGIVLFFSFIKQIFNYLFVSIEKQNVLFKINLTWVVIWVLVGLCIIKWLNINVLWQTISIPQLWLLWWIITQVLIETIFMFWAMIVAWKLKVFPKFQKKAWLQLLWILIIMLIIWFFINGWLENHNLSRRLFLIIAWIYNLFIVWISLRPLKSVAKWLTID